MRCQWERFEAGLEARSIPLLGKRDLNDQPPIIREHLRQELILSAKVRYGGQPVDGQIVNLSEAGCKVKATAHRAEIGASVFIKPSGLELIVGKVIWTQENQFGVEFQEPIYRPVVDHLVRVNAFEA